MRKTILFLLLASALAAAHAADAPRDTTIDASDEDKTLSESWPVAPGARIELDNVRGTVNVSGWDKPEVDLAGTLGSGSHLVISGDNDHLSLRVQGSGQRWFGGNGPGSDSDLVLKIPHGASLKLGVVSADATVSGIDGKSLDINGVSGTLTLSGDAPQIDVNSVSGDVIFKAARIPAGARAHLQTVSGDIRAHGLGGRIKLETVSGEIGLDSSATVDELETGTVSGDTKLVIAPSAHARLGLTSMSGDIRVHLAPTLAGHIEAKTFSGDIASDFGKARTREHGPGSTLDAHVGEGDGELKAESFSGDVELRKQ